MTPAALHRWLPAWITWRDGQPWLDWCYLGAGGSGLHEPFFEDSLNRLLRHPFNRLFRRSAPLADMPWLEEAAAARPPEGFIFHVSRCGSTLASRQLAALPDALALAEPGPVEALLHAPRRRPDVSPEQAITWLRRLLGAFRLTQGAHPGPLFVKLDAWSVHDLPRLQQAFPGTPCLFLYRDPLEVLASHARSPGRHMLPAGVEPALFGLSLETVAAMPVPEYRARVLASLYDAGLGHARAGRVRLVNYPQLPTATADWLEQDCHLELDAAARGALERAASLNAKQPGQTFTADGAAKRAEAGSDLRVLAERLLYPRYQALEAARLAIRPNAV